MEAGMQTDVILRRLTALRAADLLPLLGAADATVLRVEAPELAARSVRLDLVLHLRSAAGLEYLHLVEWQGYDQPQLLWRTMRYLAELGEQRQVRPIVCTIVYLTSAADVGVDLVQTLPDGGGRWAFQVAALRLWELDAVTYATSAPPGLAVLSPVMQGASAELVFHVAQRIVTETAADEQGELLAMLSVFAEPLIEPTVFLDLVGKERVMTSGVIGLLVAEQVAEETAKLHKELAERDRQVAEQAQQVAERDQQVAERDQRLRELYVRTIEDVLVARFPTVPLTAIRPLREITQLETLETLRTAVLDAPDQAHAVALIAAAAAG
jgi:hypothetical protein